MIAEWKDRVRRVARLLIPPPVRPLVVKPVRHLLRQAQIRRSLSSVRFTGPLARDGGNPVRDTWLRPWPTYNFGTKREWEENIAPVMKRLYLSGQEGLPQPLAKEFEKRWAEYCGVRHALLLPHGTDALRIGLAAALDHDGLDYGGEVIVPNLSFIASSTAALDRRLGVALVDVNPDTLLVDPRRVEEAIVPGKTRAIMAVHLFGQPADMGALGAIADRHGLKIIGDAAQAHGGLHEWGHAGALGDVAGFSFQSYKNLSSGEGGALTTDDPEIFERAYAFHNVGRARVGGQRWGHESLGWNCRPTEYVAAVLLQRLTRLEAEQRTRAARFETLRAQLADILCVKPLAVGRGVTRHGAHMFVVRYRAEACGGLDIGDFVRAVNAEGVPVMPLYNGITQAEQPVLRRLAEEHPEYVRVLATPVADRAAREILWLQHDLFLGSDADMEEIAAAFAKVERHYTVGMGTPAVVPPRLAESEASALQSPMIGAAPERPSTRAIRFGVIGIGMMGRNHVEAIRQHPGLTLSGITDIDVENRACAADDFGCTWFASAAEMIRSGEVDAVVIATPHWQHVEPAISALEAGLHLVCEKPLTVTTAEADRLLKAAASTPRCAAVVYQNRFEPAYRFARDLIASGEIGSVYRCSVVESAWRTRAYYTSSDWRGTWRGEGGGVLINQAPHVLDRYVWLCGMPDSVVARCDTLLHDIEVEDTASTILRHAHGVHGYIHVSTIEAPPVSRTVVACDRGRLTIDGGRVYLERLRGSIRERTATEPAFGGSIDAEAREIFVSRIGEIPRLLQAFYDNFVAAVNSTADLVCPLAEGLHAVELANAIQLSSATQAEVQLPLERDAYARWLATKLKPAVVA